MIHYLLSYNKVFNGTALVPSSTARLLTTHAGSFFTPAASAPPKGGDASPLSAKPITSLEKLHQVAEKAIATLHKATAFYQAYQQQHAAVQAQQQEECGEILTPLALMLPTKQLPFSLPTVAEINRLKESGNLNKMKALLIDIVLYAIHLKQACDNVAHMETRLVSLNQQRQACLERSLSFFPFRPF